ncbi:hypothetical protein PS15p_203285 [Mucor circinelloides]
MEDVEVNPSLIGNQPVDYSAFQVQPRISSSTEVICRCRHFNGSSNNSTTTTSIGNVDEELDDSNADTTTTAADTTTTTNANTNAAINDDDDEWDVDIQNLKLKHTQALKRKELEMEKVADEISKLQKKLRFHQIPLMSIHAI